MLCMKVSSCLAACFTSLMDGSGRGAVFGSACATDFVAASGAAAPTEVATGGSLAALAAVGKLIIAPTSRTEKIAAGGEFRRPHRPPRPDLRQACSSNYSLTAQQ